MYVTLVADVRLIDSLLIEHVYLSAIKHITLSRRVWYLFGFYQWQLGTSSGLRVRHWNENFMQNFYWRYFTLAWHFFRCCKMLILHAYQHLLSEFVDYLWPCRCISYLVCTIFVYYFQGLLQLKSFQQTPTRSKPSPGYRHSTAIFFYAWCHGGTNTDMSMATTWKSDVYHLLPMCHV